MNAKRTHKKNLIVSYKNLSDELKELLTEQYPEGYKDYLQRFEKPNGETIFVVPMETDDTVYMVKFDVKIDTAYSDDDSEKDYFDEAVEKAGEEFAPLEEALSKEEENASHTERVVRHGNYEDEDSPIKKKNHGALSELGEELEEAFSDDDFDEFDKGEEEDDEYDKEEEMDPDEPTDEELMDIDSEIFANAEIPPEELARMEAEKAAAEPAKPKRGRPRKVATVTEEPPTPKKKGRPRKNG